MDSRGRLHISSIALCIVAPLATYGLAGHEALVKILQELCLLDEKAQNFTNCSEPGSVPRPM